VRSSQILMLAALCVAIPGTAATAQAAPATLHLSPSGSDRNACTQSAPCATMDKAYRAASPGQTVLLAPGTYPTQTIKPDSRKTSAARVVFRSAPGGRAVIAGVLIGGSHIELRDLQTPWAVQAGADGVTIRNVIADGISSIVGASNVSVIGGEIFSSKPVATDPVIASLYGKVPTNILIDGVAFHDFRDVGPGNFHHIECLQVGAAVNLTIRNSTFRDCATHDIFVRSWGMVNNSPSPLSNIVIENNFFANTPDGFYGVQILDDLWTGTPKTSFIIRNNSALDSILVRVSNGTAQVRGNIIPSMASYFCSAYGQQKWFDYNLYSSGVKCGPHDRIGDPRFVDPAKLDLHLQPGSSAIAMADPANHPALDIDGKLRPVRGRVDAGASQRESAGIVLGRSIGGVTLGKSRPSINALYGAPKKTRKSRATGPTGTVSTYRTPGGSLKVLYDGKGTVVGVGTTSSYYTTRGGEGVGVAASKVRSAWKLHWLGCQKAYRRNVGPVAVYVSGRSKAVGIWQVKRAFASCDRRLP
jgi:hypothetical protein